MGCLLTPKPCLLRPQNRRDTRTGLLRAPTASTDRSKRLYTSHEYTVQVHSSKSYVNNTFVIHPAPSAARLTAEKRPPNGPREASAARPRSSPRTSRDRLPVSATSAPSPVSSGKSKEASASTHRDANAVRVLIELTRRCRAHARATWQAVYAPGTCIRELPGTSVCTTGVGSMDLGSRGMRAARIAIAFSPGAGCAQGAQTCCRRVVEEYM